MAMGGLGLALRPQRVLGESSAHRAVLTGCRCLLPSVLGQRELAGEDMYGGVDLTSQLE